MLFEIALLAYAGSLGFVAAGMTASLYQWLTAEPARLRVAGEGWAGMVGGLLFIGLVGPIVVFRSLLRPAIAERRPGRLATGALVCALWSCSLGIVLLELVLSVARL